MKATELGMAGLWIFDPPVFPDDRGAFAAPFQGDAFREALGFDLTWPKSTRVYRVAA